MTVSVENTTRKTTAHKRNRISQAIANNLRSQPKVGVTCALSLGVMLMMPNSLQAATFLVTNIMDNGSGSLREAITLANADSTKDEIVFDTTVTGTISLTSGEFTVTEPLTVSGPGASTLRIDGNYQSQIFNNSSNLEISGLAMSSGNAINGGAIYSDGGNLTIDRSTISGNHAFYNSNNTLSKGNGGGIWFKNGNLTVTESTISNNTATPNNGGGIYMGDGTTLSITNSTISHNFASLWGGGIHSRGPYTVITGTTINDNSALNGGGISNFGTLTIESSTVSNNTANSEGGGIGNFGSANASINNSTISGNKARTGGGINNYLGDLEVSNSTITGNEATRIGSGIYAYSTNTRLSNSIIANQLVGANCFHQTSFSPPIHPDDTISSQGYNLDSDGSCNLTNSGDLPNTAISIEPLADNGGPTLTHALLANSPAVDAIPIGSNDCGSANSADQRGESRPKDGNADGVSACDIGAYEIDESTGADTGRIGNFVWDDININGKQDTGEPGFADVTVNLWLNCDSNTTLTTMTDANGTFSFDNLAEGNYQLEYIKPDGYSFAPPFATGDFRVDSNADSATGLGACRYLANGQKRNALDAGLYRSDSGPIADTLSVVHAEYYPADNKVWIRAQSDALPSGSAIITVTAVTNGVETILGELTWKHGVQAYQKAFMDLASIPDTIILTSEQGGETTSPVIGGNTSPLKVDKAIYNPVDNKLWIKADTDASPPGSVTITAVIVINGVETELGQVGWKPTKNAYQQVFKNITQQPDSVIVTSNLGDTATLTVTLK